MATTDIFEHFEELPDPRMDRQKRHSLMDILFIAICSVICGATSFVDMYDFGCAKEEWFRKHLELANGIPSHDTFRRVFSIIDADAFRHCFMNWTKTMSKATNGDTIAFDGKTLRRSFDTATGLSAIHVVNAWSSENDFCVGQMKVDGKSKADNGDACSDAADGDQGRCGHRRCDELPERDRSTDHRAGRRLCLGRKEQPAVSARGCEIVL